MQWCNKCLKETEDNLEGDCGECQLSRPTPKELFPSPFLPDTTH